MATDEGRCPYCGAANSYSVEKCVACKEELPWAQWVKSRQQPSPALGAQHGDFSQRRGRGLSDGIGLLPSGATGKLLLVAMVMAAAYFAVRGIGSALHPIASSGGVEVPASQKSITEQWKKANPVIQQDAQDRREQP